ncbi:hypothetical protein MTO96_005581 [Rhipicephalus appendiculatus]
MMAGLRKGRKESSFQKWKRPFLRWALPRPGRLAWPAQELVIAANSVHSFALSAFTFREQTRRGDCAKECYGVAEENLWLPNSRRRDRFVLL